MSFSPLAGLRRGLRAMRFFSAVFTKITKLRTGMDGRRTEKSHLREEHDIASMEPRSGMYYLI